MDKTIKSTKPRPANLKCDVSRAGEKINTWTIIGTFIDEEGDEMYWCECECGSTAEVWDLKNLYAEICMVGKSEEEVREVTDKVITKEFQEKDKEN